MIRFVLFSALRSYRKNPLFTSINFIGLSLGLASFILLGLFVAREKSYDEHWKKGDRIYRVSREFFSQDGSTSLHLGHLAPPFGPLFKLDFAEQSETVVRMLQNWGGTVKYKDKLFAEDRFFFADPDFFDVFDIPLSHGNPSKILVDPGTVLISESAAKRIFGESDPMNKILECNRGMTLMVKGVYPDLPDNSHFHFDLVADMSYVEEHYGGNESMMSNWGSNNFSTFILLKEGHKIEEVSQLFPEFLKKHIDEDANDWNAIHTMNVRDIHLKSHLDTEIENNGDSKIVYTFITIAILVLLLACVNYINLSLARAGDRAKEVGVRKSLGATKAQISGQFLFESSLLAFSASLFGLILAYFGSTIVNDLTGVDLRFELQNSIIGIIFFATFSVLLGIVSGIYPSFILSSFQPSRVLKGDFKLFNSGVRLKEALVVFQFAIASFLIFSTTIIFQQLQYMENKSLGYDKENLIILSGDNEVRGKIDLVYERILKIPGIVSVTGGNIFPTNRLLNSGGARIEFGDSMVAPNVVIKAVDVDYKFFETFGVDLLAGRDFSVSFSTDDTMAFILNENAVHMIGWKNLDDAIGKKFRYWGRNGKIIGVVSDFHMESLHSEISPIVFRINKEEIWQIGVKYSGNDPMEIKDQLSELWAELAPNLPFQYEFLDSRYEELYDQEQSRGKLFTLFSILAISIAGLGLLGLTIYYLSQRLKEVSLRKILGASVSQLFYFISWHFLKLVLISFIIGIPMGWYFSNIWLENFAFKIEIGSTAIFLSVLLSLFLASIPLLWTTIRAVRINPIIWLRNE